MTYETTGRAKRSLQGHKRQLVAIGGIPVARHSPPGGWMVGCKCGELEVGPLPNKREAEAAYAAHVLEEVAKEPTCKHCGIQQPLAKMSTTHRYLCKKCRTALGREWARRNVEQDKRHKRHSHLRKVFNLSLREYEALMDAQGGRCAICRSEPNDKRGFHPHIDHDHETGKVRGVLCMRCNMGLGNFGDDREALLRAVRYLDRFRKEQQRG